MAMFDFFKRFLPKKAPIATKNRKLWGVFNVDEMYPPEGGTRDMSSEMAKRDAMALPLRGSESDSSASKSSGSTISSASSSDMSMSLEERNRTALPLRAPQPGADQNPSSLSRLMGDVSSIDSSDSEEDASWLSINASKSSEAELDRNRTVIYLVSMNNGNENLLRMLQGDLEASELNLKEAYNLQRKKDKLFPHQKKLSSEDLFRYELYITEFQLLYPLVQTQMMSKDVSNLNKLNEQLNMTVRRLEHLNNLKNHKGIPEEMPKAIDEKIELYEGLLIKQLNELPPGIQSRIRLNLDRHPRLAAALHDLTDHPQTSAPQTGSFFSPPKTMRPTPVVGTKDQEILGLIKKLNEQTAKMDLGKKPKAKDKERVRNAGVEAFKTYNTLITTIATVHKKDGYLSDYPGADAAGIAFTTALDKLPLKIRDKIQASQRMDTVQQKMGKTGPN